MSVKNGKAQKELSLWEIIKPVNQQVYTAMTASATSGLAWIASLVLILPIARELLADTPDTTLLWRLWGIMLAAVVVAFILRIFSIRWSHLSAFKLEEILRTQLTSHLAKVPLGFVITIGSGALKKIRMDDIRNLHSFVADSTPLIARGYTTPIVALVVMFVVDWRMALISLAVFPFGLAAMWFGIKDFAEGRQAYDAAQEQINRTIIEYVQGMQVVRTFDDGTTSFKR